MVKPLLSVVFFGLVLSVSAQDFEINYTTPVSKTKGHIVLLGSTLAVLQPDSATYQRYVATNLPAEYKKDGLAVIFSGKTGEPPPNAQMAGTPLRLACIKVRGDYKRFKVKKRGYRF